MHDIWNPWHGCIKKSEGCANCYMMALDRIHHNEKEGIYQTSSFNYPLQKNRNGEYKVKPGELIRVCMTSDFFIEEADEFRNKAWQIIKRRSDVKFYILTKRPERIEQCLPDDWNDGYENVILNVTCENQKRADERIPILFSIKAKHKGIMCAPLLGEIDLEKYLQEGIIEQIICGGENYGGERACDFSWVKKMSNQAKKYDVTFAFIETGTIFIKDQKKYIIKDKLLQSKMAYKSNVSYVGKKSKFILKNEYGPIDEKNLYVPRYTSINCLECGSRIICNGCSNCGKCIQIGDIYGSN